MTLEPFVWTVAVLALLGGLGGLWIRPSPLPHDGGLNEQEVRERDAAQARLEKEYCWMSRDHRTFAFTYRGRAILWYHCGQRGYKFSVACQTPGLLDDTVITERWAPRIVCGRCGALNWLD